MRLNRFLRASIRIVITLMVLVWILSKVNFKEVLKILSSFNPLFGFLGVVFVFLGLALSGYRWYIFLKPEGITPVDATFITLGALFYGMFLPAGAGVDIIRGFYVGIKTGSKSETFASVFIDRMVGFLALLSIAAMAMILGSKTMRHIGGFIVAGLVTTFFLSVVILSRRLRKVAIKLVERIKFLGIGNRVSSFLKAFEHYRENPYLVLLGFTISLFMQTLLGVGAYFIGVSIGVIKMSVDLIFVKTIVYTSLVNLITMVPVTIGGVGIREGGFVYLMGHYTGYEGAISISILYYLANIVASLPGMIFILRMGFPDEHSTSSASRD